MAESYNAIAIRMGIDTSQFDAGLRRAQKQIDDVAARMAQASEENRQRASMAAGMTGMGVGVTPEDRRLSEQIATRLKINQIINQQNQLFEQNRARQQAINAETERYNRVTSTLLVNMIRRTEQAAIDKRQFEAAAQERDRHLSKEIQTRLILNTIRNQQNKLFEEEARIAAATDARAAIRKMFTREEEKTNELLAFQNKQRRELLDLQKQLDAANIHGRTRQNLIQQFQAQQAVTKAKWEDSYAQRNMTDLEREAEAVKNQLITAEQRHATKLANLKLMLQQNLLTQKQYAAAVQMTNDALDMQQGRFGRMSGAIAQASFAVEDFAQVLSMGGGLNMALMSASNNVAMVVRSLFAANAAMSATAGLAIPFVMIGISQLFRSFQSQANATEEWVKSLSDYFDTLNFSLDQAQTKQERQRELEDIRQAKGGGTSASNIDEINKSLLEQQRVQEDLGLMESKRDSIIRQIASGSDELAKGINDRAENMLMLADSIGGIVETMLGPSPSERPEAIRALRDEHLEIARIADETFRQNLKNASSLEEFILANQIYLSQIAEIPGIAARNERERITAMLDNEEKTKEHFTSLEELQHKLNVEEEKQLKLRTELIKSLEREEQQRKDILFAMTASPEAKLQADLEKQRQEFVGITPSDIMVDPRLQQEYLQRSTDFLLAAQDQTQKQIDELQKAAAPAFTGDLQQDAFKAQAEAFKQMDQARQQQRNPQLDQQIDLLRRINDALNSGGTITLVGGP